MHKLGDAATVAPVRFLELLADPALDVNNVGEVVDGRPLACSERREADAEAEIVDVLLDDDVVSCNRDRRVDQELEEGFAGEGPAFGISVGSMALAWTKTGK